MRCAALAVVVGAGCGPAIRSPDLPPIEPTNLIDPTTYEKRISDLRATLGRSGIALDDEPTVQYCGDHHGAERCMKCDVARREDTADIDPDLIAGVAIAFGAYPPQMLEAAELQHVALCRKLRDQDDAADDIGGAAFITDHRVVISIAPFVGQSHRYGGGNTIEQIVHHEVFHLFDHATLGIGASDPAWTALNPSSFAYRNPTDDECADRPAGFVNRYATTNEREDRATVFEYLMAHPNKLCEIAKTDAIVKSKTAAVWKRVAKVMGDDLLRQHAPCVDWVGKRGPAKKSLPRPRTRSNR